MMTQNVQALGCHLGHATPALFQRSGLAEEYRKIMIEAADCWKAMADWKPEASSYVVPNGYNRRLLLTMNLREAHQFIRLRSGARAHFAVRRVARRMAEEIVKVQPLLSGLFQSIEGETWQSIEKDHFEDLQA
jgi:thymidylate synthase ThyX